MESHVEEKKVTPPAADPKKKSPEQIRMDQERKGLQLSRTRIANDLENATNPNHRKSLEAALAFLDQKISALNN